MTEKNTPANTEVELRVFEVDSDTIRRTLTSLGAVSLGTKEFKRAVLDVQPVDLNKWIRVRTTGDVTTLSVKERRPEEGQDGEVEIEVADFDKTLELLELLNGYTPRSIQESRREDYVLDGVEISIDSWPMIKDFIELESQEKDIDAIYRAANELGIDEALLTGKSVEAYYHEKLGIDIKTTPLRFEQ